MCKQGTRPVLDRVQPTAIGSPPDSPLERDGFSPRSAVGPFGRTRTPYQEDKSSAKAQERAEPEVRIHLPPADSPSLSRSHFRASKTRAFPAVCEARLTTGVSRDAAGFPLRANRRQCLCRAIFQYRSEADAVSGNATTVRTKSGVSGLSIGKSLKFGSGSSKAEQGPLVVPGKRQT